MFEEFLKEYLTIIIFFIVALGLSMAFVAINYLASPKNPDPEKPDSYYFKVDVKAQDEEDDSLLYAPNLILTVSIIAMITLINRR